MSYTMQSDTALQMFSLDEKSGEVWSRRTFDRETMAVYEVSLVATDTGGRAGFTTLGINVGDVNDNAPKFELSEYKANIHANLSIGSEVLRVKARDADASGSPNSAVTYAIYERKDSGINKVFQVDATTGQVRLKSSIAKLENQVYQFFVRASDAGTTQALHSDVPVEVYSQFFVNSRYSQGCSPLKGKDYEL